MSRLREVAKEKVEPASCNESGVCDWDYVAFWLYPGRRVTDPLLKSNNNL